MIKFALHWLVTHMQHIVVIANNCLVDAIGWEMCFYLFCSALSAGRLDMHWSVIGWLQSNAPVPITYLLQLIMISKGSKWDIAN